MGIRPDLIVEIRRDVLEETDGPMLKFGLQEIAGQLLLIPRSKSQKPAKEYLEERYEMFRRAG
jgi:putative restriction endonuclease